MALGPQLTAALQRYGLTDLTDWASQALVEGKSEDQIMLEMYDQPTFRLRFDGMFKREANGYAPVSIDDYLSYENMASALGTTWGMNLSKAEVDNLIANNVSAREVEQRFTIAATAVYEGAPETRAELTRLFGVSQENMMRYWMEPKQHLGVLQQQYRMGELAGAAMRTGFGQLNQSQASRLQQAGLTEDQAMSGFGQLRKSMELFTPLDEGESLFDVDEQLGLLTDDADTEADLAKRQDRRKAEFGGSGGYATGQQGFATGTAQ